MFEKGTVYQVQPASCSSTSPVSIVGLIPVLKDSEGFTLIPRDISEAQGTKIDQWMNEDKG